MKFGENRKPRFSVFEMKKSTDGLFHRSIGLAIFLACLVCAGCGADPERLVEKTLEARAKALRDMDVKAYVALFHPDYRYRKNQPETVTSKITKIFMVHDYIQLSTHNRRISFEEDGQVARVVQEFRIVAVEKNGKRKITEGTDHFLLKKKRGLFTTRFLFYEGLGV